ncbi:MAG: hypothetical protein GFH27_549325n16 [Chloroflexi bacterium AL-W]|nr:hypothetical protein [Chloroflexi bacterium AL-N1]NOK70134.1 hypothetical protein [Chloroflexi bacterium AL-N10]NOK77854.1 hypothetical protein [Chloroflexi bacterium AL-N5]NOK84863.1 hypothetical protein [Chloroflexi bacterium AL-W]NOK91842.1 hypothetical protein [Chloroflexi bacterium AL-N15]
MCKRTPHIGENCYGVVSTYKIDGTFTDTYNCDCKSLLADLDKDDVCLLLTRIIPFQAALATGLFTNAHQQMTLLYEQQQATFKADYTAIQTRYQAIEKGLQAVLTHTPLAMFIVDDKEVITYVTGCSLITLGITDQNPLGCHIDILACQEPKIVGAVRTAFMGEDVIVVIQRETQTFEFHCILLTNKMGVRGVTGVLLEITEQKSSLPGTLSHVTAADRELLVLLAEGETNRTIGFSLGIGPKAVEKRLTKLFGKLNVRTRTEAVSVAMRTKLI